jgi:phenylalanyl-tRNA synthetase beta subunit
VRNQHLKTHWEAALLELLRRHEAGREMLASEMRSSATWWALQNRHYVKDAPEVRGDRLVHVLTPTPKALTWVRNGLLPGELESKAMNYPKIGPVRVFALGNIIHVVDANGGKPFLFNHTEARELSKSLRTLADAIYVPEKDEKEKT